MQDAPYTLSGPLGQRATLGLVVLQVDETIEHDFRRLMPLDGVALHVTRIASGDTLTPESIAQMEVDLPAATALLPPAARFDVVGYACTSGTTLIGQDRVTTLVSDAVQTRAVTDPLTATQRVFAHLGARRIAVVSPYIASVAQPLQQALAEGGCDIVQTLSFGEEIEANVARISPESLIRAARAVGAGHDVDAVFLSCTNLRTLDILAPLEAELDKPVLSSNLTLAWDMARLSGLQLNACCRLLEKN